MYTQNTLIIKNLFLKNLFLGSTAIRENFLRLFRNTPVQVPKELTLGQKKRVSIENDLTTVGLRKSEVLAQKN